MSRPLIPNRKRESEAAQFHRAVFSQYGGSKKICALCGKPGAVDAAHVIPRSRLGPLRYADVRFARPAHRECHTQVDRHEIGWPEDVYRDAVLAHNAIAKIRIVEPA